MTNREEILPGECGVDNGPAVRDPPRWRPGLPAPICCSRQRSFESFHYFAHGSASSSGRPLQGDGSSDSRCSTMRFASKNGRGTPTRLYSPSEWPAHRVAQRVAAARRNVVLDDSLNRGLPIGRLLPMRFQGFIESSVVAASSVLLFCLTALSLRIKSPVRSFLCAQSAHFEQSEAHY